MTMKLKYSIGIGLVVLAALILGACAAKPNPGSTALAATPAVKSPVTLAATTETKGEQPMIYTEEQASTVCYIQPTEELKQKLKPEEYAVLVQAATEPPFQNSYWDNHRAGIYVDRIDGTPLFASSTKFESGTGWPSFWKPIDQSAIILVEDHSLGMDRIEVRSKKSGGHLGHLFNDGPNPTGLRYCINSASLEFVPKDEMAKRGYGALLSLLTEQD
jgi:methionine-R-sulfoxide reductase